MVLIGLEFVNILGIQHQELLYTVIIGKYNDGNIFGSVAACILALSKFVLD